MNKQCSVVGLLVPVSNVRSGTVILTAFVTDMQLANDVFSLRLGAHYPYSRPTRPVNTGVILDTRVHGPR